MPIDLGPNALTTSGNAPAPMKAKFLIVLDDGANGKTRNFQRFISLDKPQSTDGFVTVKGFFVDKTEEEIIKTFGDILTSTPKELYLEMMFPLHRIFHIRSLVFNAVKTITPVTPGKA